MYRDQPPAVFLETDHHRPGRRAGRGQPERRSVPAANRNHAAVATRKRFAAMGQAPRTGALAGTTAAANGPIVVQPAQIPARSARTLARSGYRDVRAARIHERPPETSISNGRIYGPNDTVPGGC